MTIADDDPKRVMPCRGLEIAFLNSSCEVVVPCDVTKTKQAEDKPEAQNTKLMASRFAVDSSADAKGQRPGAVTSRICLGEGQRQAHGA